MGWMTQYDYDCRIASCQPHLLASSMVHGGPLQHARAAAISRADELDQEGICPHVDKENS